MNTAKIKELINFRRSEVADRTAVLGYSEGGAGVQYRVPESSYFRGPHMDQKHCCSGEEGAAAAVPSKGALPRGMLVTFHRRSIESILEEVR